MSEPVPLEIPRDLHDAMVTHCVREAPLECCGMLAGVAPRASLFLPLRNAAPIETRSTRYFAEPRDLFLIEKTLRRLRLEILAIYHSHPRAEPVPSRTDLRENHYGTVPQIIVSLLGKEPVVRVWRFDESSYHELTWRIVGPDPPGDAAGGCTQDPGGLYYRSYWRFTTLGKNSTSMQRTLIIFKPDCVQRRLVGAILQRFETKGLRIAAMKLIGVDRALAEKHYAEHEGKPFFEGLIGFITSSPVMVGVLEGNEAIAVVRAMLGATNGAAAAPGTIRGDFSISKQNNLLHGSDSPESARREIALWFRPEELADYAIDGENWVSAGS
jgi:nucleoside-diphosphate kinase